VTIVRQILRREAPVTFDGDIYQIPYHGADATGLGKPLKSTLHAQPDIPIYLAAIGPKNVALAAEIGDGWLPIFFAPRQYGAVYAPHMEQGLARANKALSDFDVAPMTPVVIDDSLDACYNALRPMMALYIGGMGARNKNFYHDLAVRYGYEAAAHEIQELYLAGQRGEAMSKVPGALIDEVALVGPKERVRDRLALWQESPANTLNMMIQDVQTLRSMVELADRVGG
jgi:F420-dependent oxidoreductase-like protein